MMKMTYFYDDTFEVRGENLKSLSGLVGLVSHLLKLILNLAELGWLVISRSSIIPAVNFELK